MKARKKGKKEERRVILSYVYQFSYSLPALAAWAVLLRTTEILPEEVEVWQK